MEAEGKDGPQTQEAKIKKEIKTERAEDVWMAASCFEEEEEECKVKVEEKWSSEELEEEEDNHPSRVKDQLEKSKCKVVIRDCIGQGRWKWYGPAAKWLLGGNSIVVRDEVGNFCQFFCQRCGGTFPSYKCITKHKKKAGCEGIPPRMSTASAHECSICSVIVLNDLTQLNSHYQDKHNVCFRKHLQSARYGYALQTSMYDWKEQAASFLKECSLSSEVGDMCSFRCRGCDKIFTSLCSYQNHNYSFKKKGLPPCSTDDGTIWLNFVEKAVAHRCKLCSKLLLCDKRIMCRHFSSQHKITVSMYMKRHLSQKTELDSDTVMKLKRETPIVPTQFGNYITSPDSVPREKTTNKVENLCIFKCRCSFHAKSYFSLVAHSKKCKEFSGMVNLKTAAEFVVEARYHCCRVCTRRVLCDKGLINCHIRSAHKYLNNEGYAQLAGKREQHNEREREKEATRFADLLKKVPMITPHKTHITLPNSLPKSMTTDIVENLCKYRCKEESCSFSASTWSAMGGHMKKNHGLPTSTYHPTCLVEARYHKCRFCSRDILCDKNIISRHAHGYHHMSLEQYMAAGNGKPEKGVMVQINKKKYRRLFPKDTIPHEFVVAKVANACTFTCPHCGKKSVSSTGFSHHLLRSCVKRTIISKNVTEARYHECRLCCRVMLCDYTIIKTHIQRSHNTVTSPKAYMERVGVLSREETQEIRQKIPADYSYAKHATILGYN